MYTYNELIHGVAVSKGHMYMLIYKHEAYHCYHSEATVSAPKIGPISPDPSCLITDTATPTYQK